jgi:hypothetical protein
VRRIACSPVMRRPGLSQVAVQARVAADGEPLPRKPNAVLAPAPTAPFQEAFLAVTVEPEVVTSALHGWVMDWPDASRQCAVVLGAGVLCAVRWRAVALNAATARV